MEKKPSADAYQDGAAEKPRLHRQAVSNSTNPMDTLFASIERTACFGRCPVYKAYIWQSGYTTFEGIRFSEREGLFCTRLSAAEMKRITDKARQISFFKMKDAYDDPQVTDLPSVITFLREGKKSKTVKDRYQAPETLKSFEELMDKILDSKEWKSLGRKEESH